jgi:hypothetical protein
MCNTNAECACHFRGGLRHWWTAPGRAHGPYHATDNCVCGDGRCMPDDTWRSAIGGVRTQAQYDPAWNGLSPQAIIHARILPEHCKVCNHHNPYVGEEHLVCTNKTKGLMEYVCRQCRPAWDRKARLDQMKHEAILREEAKTQYGPAQGY